MGLFSEPGSDFYGTTKKLDDNNPQKTVMQLYLITSEEKWAPRELMSYYWRVKVGSARVDVLSLASKSGLRES